MEKITGTILVVDDTDFIRDLLNSRLKRLGYTVVEARDGREALALMRATSFDLVLLDIMMPVMDGYQVLENIKADDQLKHIPVVVISAIADQNSVVRCIELGATDYLPKPFKDPILQARVESSMEKKRLHDNELAHLQMIEDERARSDQLLLNILPAPIAARLKAGEVVIADHHPNATVMFIDLAGFTQFAGFVPPVEVVATLSLIFAEFDDLAKKYGVEKIKTSGDAYIAVAGLNKPISDPVSASAEMALDILDAMGRLCTEYNLPFTVRVGIHAGPVVAGVIGTEKFSYDLWGDTVNIASRMEAQGVDGSIQVTLPIYERLKDRYQLTERGTILVKGKGEMKVFLLTGRKAASHQD
jgi:class 3 adenylate cyclase